MAKPVPRWISATAWAVFRIFRREAVANTATWGMFRARKVPRKDRRPRMARVIPSGLSAPSST